MTRITNKDLKAVVDRINKITGSPEKPYRVEDTVGHFQTRANIGNYHLSYAYGGVCLERMCNESGGVTTPLGCGHIPKRDLYNAMQAYMKGLEESRIGSAE
jgi:hypothetical protein